MHSTDNLAEADRLMTVCNSCRYCEGLCAVFPAMELRRAFEDGDLNYLANLCHNCGACYSDCQFSPPHEFNVNVPQVLAKVRADSWQSYAWPAALQPIFARSGVWIALAVALSIAAFLLGIALWRDPEVLVSGGSFYRAVPHNVMATLFLAATAWTVCAFVIGFRNFWKDAGAAPSRDALGSTLWQAARNALSLRYLDGGGDQCYNAAGQRRDWRRLFHHLVFYGFMLCFASTLSGTAMHYLLDHPAPYALHELPKLLGIPGGIALVVGTIGLLREKLRRDPMLADRPRLGMDVAFIVMMGLAGLTGLLLTMLRDAAGMGVLLALHLGVILGLYLTMPYGKFVHALYRVGALFIYAIERRSGAPIKGAAIGIRTD